MKHLVPHQTEEVVEKKLEFCSSIPPQEVLFLCGLHVFYVLTFIDLEYCQ